MQQTTQLIAGEESLDEDVALSGSISSKVSHSMKFADTSEVV